jgi:hypothetical protein
MSSKFKTFHYKKPYHFTEIITKKSSSSNRHWLFYLNTENKKVHDKIMIENNDNLFTEFTEDFEIECKEEHHTNKNNKTHRLNYPAYIYTSNYGTILKYMTNGDLHRLDGPAYSEYNCHDNDDDLFMFDTTSGNLINKLPSYTPQGKLQYCEYWINDVFYEEKNYKKIIFYVKKFISNIKSKLRVKKQDFLVKIGFVKDIAFIVCKYIH